MNLTEFLNYTYPTKPEAFGEFLEGRRTELKYTISYMADVVDMTPRQYRRIENGEIPVPMEILPILLHELQISKEEYKAFLDLANLSHQSWPKITNHLTTRPYARKFLELAETMGMSDEAYKGLYEKLLAKCIKIVSEKKEQNNPSDDNEGLAQ